MLFKVEKTSTVNALFDGSFRVKRVCKESDILAKFCDKGDGYTPLKV